MASELPTSSEFIRHHLTNLTFGQHPDGSWGMAHTNEEVANMGFMAIHVDSLFWSFVLGALFVVQAAILFSAIALAAGQIQPLLMRLSPRFLAGLTSGLFMLLAAYLALSNLAGTQPD